MFQPGRQIGSYTLIKRLGRGGFGEVWLAERRAKFVTTKVAVKLPLEEQVDIEAVKQEAVLWEQASGHPNVLPIIDADEYDGQVVIVSEYAPSGSLEDVLQENRALPIRTAVEMAIGILSGLEFLHSRQIIHRDIKPANILLQGDTPRLADFGISRVMRTNSTSVNVAGTPHYMAPEAFDRKRNVQTDIWSVGVVLYRMLKGNLPFPHADFTDLLGAIFNNQPEPLPDTIPLPLHRVIMKALARQPAERYQTAREMREDLLDVLVVISQKDFKHIPQPIKPTNNSWLKYIVMVLLVLIVAGGMMVWLNSRAKETIPNSGVKETTPNPVKITATASTTRIPKGNSTYEPGNVLDQSLATAWVEGAPGPGIGEWIQFDFNREVKLNRITVIPGYFKTPELWGQNNRLARAMFYFSDGTSRLLTFEDRMVEKSLDVGGIRTSWVRMEIGGVYRGSADMEDTPISNVAFDWE